MPGPAPSLAPHSDSMHCAAAGTVAGSGMSKEEEAVVEKHLHDLGYL